jgi:hypothetical protein
MDFLNLDLKDRVLKKQECVDFMCKGVKQFLMGCSANKLSSTTGILARKSLY